MRLNMRELTAIKNLMEQVKTHRKEIEKLHKAGIDFRAGIEVSLESFLCDICGVPEDNCEEMRATDIANETGEWPEGAYCRDWVLQLLNDFEEDRETADEVLDKLLKENDRWNARNHNR